MGRSKEPDLSSCPYYQNRWLRDRPELPGTCTRGCCQEPACVTDQPLNGWPSERNPMATPAEEGDSGR